MGTCRFVTPTEKRAPPSRRPHPIQALEHITRERFPRRARLARAAEVRACWDSGRRHRTRFLDVAWRPNHSGRPRAAIVVPRFHHTAVARNRLRRRLREVLRRGALATLPPLFAMLTVTV